MVSAPCTTRADDQEDARKVVSNAIRAAGGQEALGRYKARTWKEKAVYHGAGGDERYEASYSAAWPDKIRVDTGDYTLIVNGNKGWIRAKDQTRDMTSEELKEHMEGIYAVWVLSLAPLGNNEFKLSPLHLSGGKQREFRPFPEDGIDFYENDHLVEFFPEILVDDIAVFTHLAFL